MARLFISNEFCASRLEARQASIPYTHCLISVHPLTLPNPETLAIQALSVWYNR